MTDINLRPPVDVFQEKIAKVDTPHSVFDQHLHPCRQVQSRYLDGRLWVSREGSTALGVGIGLLSELIHREEKAHPVTTKRDFWPLARTYVVEIGGAGVEIDGTGRSCRRGDIRGVRFVLGRVGSGLRVSWVDPVGSGLPDPIYS